jgi:hypothetical protein
VGDFNGDGIPDLTVAGPGGTRVLLGNGDGSFQTTNLSYATGYATSVTVGDFNGDGLPDLAVTQFGGGVTILKNDGLWFPRPDRAPRRQAPTRHVSIALRPNDQMKRMRHPCQALCLSGLGGDLDSGAEGALTDANREPVGNEPALFAGHLATISGVTAQVKGVSGFRIGRKWGQACGPVGQLAKRPTRSRFAGIFSGVMVATWPTGHHTCPHTSVRGTAVDVSTYAMPVREGARWPQKRARPFFAPESP